MGPRAASSASTAAADQAAGLRDLLGRRCVRILPVLGYGDEAGQGAIAAQLARCLGRAGRRVVLLDADGAALRALGIRADVDLKQLLDGECDFAQVARRGGPGLRALAARSGLRSLIAADAASDEFFAGFMRLSEPADFIVINLPPLSGPGGRLWLPQAAGEPCEALVVTTPGERALTATYALIKQACLPAAPAGAPSFRILVNGADGERDARTSCRQLSDTVRRFLGAAVGYAGNVPRSARDTAFGAGAAGPSTAPFEPYAEAARVFTRLAGEIPGWRLAECTHDDSVEMSTH